MGLYNVIEPCVAGNVQFVRPTAEFQPVEIDDEAAKDAVAEGKLTPYLPGGVVEVEVGSYVVMSKSRPKSRVNSTGHDEG